MKTFFASVGRALLTLFVVLVAIVAGWQLWSYYCSNLGRATAACAPTWSRSPLTFPA
jgi:predicted negative regulator of RcsB-dependent stress response